MKIFAYTVLALTYLSVVIGEPCRFNVPVTRSVLKCGDQIYHRSPEVIAASNECAAGKNGTEMRACYIDCLSEKLDNSKNGGKGKAAFIKMDFPQHHEALLKGMKGCRDANPRESDLKDPLKHVACIVQVYQDVCKHKSCDWINTSD